MITKANRRGQLISWVKNGHKLLITITFEIFHYQYFLESIP